MSTKRLLLAALASCAALVPATGEPLDRHPRYAPLVESWRGQTDLFDVPGFAVAVIEGDDTWIETGGVRNPSGDPVTPDTIFYIASITKTYLATLAAMLAEEGALDLDDPVVRHLPRFDLAGDTDESAITVRDLLAHRPGLNSSEIVLLDAYTGEITEDRYYHWLSQVTPEGKTTYTNVHFTLAGRVVETVLGMDWRDALDRRLFTPAGLSRTTGYASEMYGDADSATPLERVGDTWRAVDQRKTDRTMHAAGGLGTSIADAARYLRLHLDAGLIGDTRIFSEATARDLHREHSTHEPNGSLRVMTGFGLGWRRGTFNDVPFLAHGGGYAGTSAYVVFFPEQHAAVAVLVNGGSFAGGWSAAVAVDVFEAITGTEAEWKPWERFSGQVTKIKAERAAAGGAGDDEAGSASTPAVSLTRPIGLYTGAFRNPWLGTLNVSRAGERLELHLGDRRIAYAPGGSDELLLTELTEPPAPLRFLVDARGRIDRVSITDEDWGEMIFER